MQHTNSLYLYIASINIIAQRSTLEEEEKYPQQYKTDKDNKEAQKNIYVANIPHRITWLHFCYADKYIFIISVGCHGCKLIQSQQPIIGALSANLQSLIAQTPSYAL